MANSKPVQSDLTSTSSNSSSINTTPFETRESKEIVIAIGGPVGSGQKKVIEILEQILLEFDYKVEVIKLSKEIQNSLEKKVIEIDESKYSSSNKKADRYSRLQEAGNELRKKYRNDILAEIAVGKIAQKRVRSTPGAKDMKDFEPDKTAWIIDQLKHPDEVNFLRSIYGNLFFLIGVLCGQKQRKKRLQDESIPSDISQSVIDRDRNENIIHGQKLDKTLQHADYFIRNTNDNIKNIKDQVNRFLDLTHGKNGITPTKHEYAMYTAYATGLKSACLSRQVGAAITDEEGNIISTGTNDVPKAGGGLYSPEDHEEDYRCINKAGKCYNQINKNEIAKEIKDKVEDKIASTIQESNDQTFKKNFGEIKDKLIDSIFIEINDYSRIKDLIEFSRSVHAEMDAITTAARIGGRGLRGGYLYTTTYPCHNCARHIIATGIKKVYYIEPYEKSLAFSLHDDAISIDEDQEDDETKVQFIHYEGVAARRYYGFFLELNERKSKDGIAVTRTSRESRKIIPELIDSYRDYESKVYQRVTEEGLVETITP